MLKAYGISVNYGEVRALDGIDLYVGDGEIVALIGANGAGKSTLLNTISGFNVPNEGEIIFQGEKLHGLEPEVVVRKGLAQVPEGREMFPSLTVSENLLMGAYLVKDRQRRASALDEVFELFPILKKRYHNAAQTLSGGEQQMLALARALMSNPKMMMLDEPSLGIAPILVEEIFKVIQSLNRSGLPILLVEQNVFLSLKISNRGYVLERGKIVLDDKSENLLKNPELWKRPIWVFELLGRLCVNQNLCFFYVQNGTGVGLMAKMAHRERLLAACNHREPDRVPLDFGSTMSTTIIEPGYDKLKEYLGFEHENRILVLRQGSISPDESILKRLGIDTRGVSLGAYRGGPDKQLDADTYFDIWHTTWKRASEGHYINIDGPFQKAEPHIGQLEAFNWPDPENPGFYENIRESAKKLRNETDYAIVFNMPVGVVHQGQFMRGFMEWLTDLYQRPDYITRMNEFIADIWIGIAERALDLVGDLVDVVTWGDDIAMQQGLFFNPDLYRKIIKPFHKRMIAAVKSKTDAKLWYHSCGAVYPLIEDLIEIGVDILNPIQVSAKDMDPAALKADYGDKLTFWGGIDTQHLLPFGTAEEVRQGVRDMIDKLGPGGGYILTSVHNIQKDVPPENIAAMFDEAKRYGVYDS